MTQKRKDVTISLGANRASLKAKGRKRASASGAEQAEPNAMGELNSAGQALHVAAESHGEAAQAACLDALSRTLELARGEALNAGVAARKIRTIAEVLALATSDAEFNLR